ncbi:hypothetical protein HYC85_003305 [Camellia sinensis]|uniref:CBS domain-containing protein n=1 Tax=Camellia sinensis TaxID=4442 RepID=A0A7J7IC39_CAMSI|nr:hypothetical protein HYC85_003305 [Camellia sinensis]
MVYTVFQWPYGGREVFLCFSCTGWTDRTRMTLVEGSSLIFQLICDLPPGCYQYKFWVDGVWRFNDQQLYVQDEYESINNVILVKEIIMEIDNSGNPHNEASSSVGRHHEPEISDIDISRRHLCMYLSSQKIYELIPNSGKVFALDAEVAVKEAFHAMYKQGLAVVPIWDSNRRQISGMLTASDFILILMELHRNRAALTDERLEVHTISAWKEGKSQQYGEAVRAAQLKFGRPLIWAGPDESLKDVALMILQNKISTVPIIYSTIEESCPLLLHIACLGGILKYICRHFKNHLDCLPILRQPVGSLPLGTWKSEVGEAHAHLLALRPSETLSYALNILIEAQISSIPIVDGKGSLINVYSRSDITSLAKDSLYTRIQLDQTIMSQVLELVDDHHRCQTCTRSDPLYVVMERLSNPVVRRLIVVEAGSQQVEGVISLTDVFNFILG